MRASRLTPVQRLLALLWLAVVIGAGLYLAARAWIGVSFRTDLAALLPYEETDRSLQRASDLVAGALAQRLVVAVGHSDPDQARAAAALLAEALRGTGRVELADMAAAGERMRQLGALYHAHRAGLLAPADRQALSQDHGESLQRRALSQIFGPVPIADSQLIRDDPFLLLPAFLSGLPLPLGRLGLEQGWLGTPDGDTYWVVLPGRLRASAFDIAAQDSVSAALDAALQRARLSTPDIAMLRLGAVFYAHAATTSAMQEVNRIGTVSIVGTVLLVLLVFRSLMPLFLTQLSILIGVGTGFATALYLFDDLHVMSLLLGLSLIGVVADYSFYYCAQIFAPGVGDARDRLRRVLPGITMGLLATMTGYGLLLLAPLPGFRQLAVVAIAGLIGAYATVLFWYPAIDRSRPRQAPHLMRWAQAVWAFWHEAGWRRWRLALASFLVLAAVVGLTRFHVDDDVRRLQNLAPELLAQQKRLEALAGAGGGTQFFVVRAADHESALQRSEALFERLQLLQQSGELTAFRGPASFVPSQQRQAEDRALKQRHLGEARLAAHLERIGLAAESVSVVPTLPLTLDRARGSGALEEILAETVVRDGDGVAHIVLVEGLRWRRAALDSAAAVPGVSFVDPAADFSNLLGRYRQRALLLVSVSALVVGLLLAVRFTLRGALAIMLPALAAAALAPLLRAAFGAPFTFFDAMALILVLGINIDYAIFCAESAGGQASLTLIGVWMTMVSTLMSFGLLAFSDVAAVHAFGATTAAGVVLSALLAPLASRREGKQ